MEWIDGINRALRYVEAHLESGLNIAMLARESCFSQFYFQRMFAMLTDMTLSEYIRSRRLSQAGQELQMTGAKVIDVALKYGYETPESFQKAFRRFHGVSPSMAKRTRIQLRYLNPLQIQVILTGGTLMDYSVESIGKLTFLGMERRFCYDDCFKKIPEFWSEYYAQGMQNTVPGYLGVCLDREDGPDFTYLIASFCDGDAPVPKGYVKLTLQPHTWVKFRAVGKIPSAIQRVNRQIFTEWLPNNPEYALADNINIEMYTEGDMDGDDYVSEIWIPVVSR